MSRIWLVCFRFTCRRIQLILRFFSSSIHVFLPHGVFVVPFLEAQEPTPGSLVGGCGSSHCTVGGGSWLLNVAPSHCVSALLHQCNTRTMLQQENDAALWPEGCNAASPCIFFHSIERCFSVRMHCCTFILTNAM